MKPTNATLNTILASRQFYIADLYTITLAGGTVLRYCSGQSNIIGSTGSTYSCGAVEQGPYFDRTDNRAKVNWKTGAGSDQLVIDVMAGSATVLNLPFISAVRAGMFDGADFQLSRAHMTTYGTVATGCDVLLFRGRIAETAADRSKLTLTVNDYRELLNQNMPHNLFAAGCANTLYDASCTVNPTTFSSTTTVAAGSSAQFINAVLAQPSGYYDMGKVTFTSGALSGLSFGVSSWNGTALTFIAPLSPVPSIGDSFVAFAGCDRSTGAGGCTKFSNISNFRGFPYVPDPQTAV